MNLHNSEDVPLCPSASQISLSYLYTAVFFLKYTTYSYCQHFNIIVLHASSPLPTDWANARPNLCSSLSPHIFLAEPHREGQSSSLSLSKEAIVK